MKKQRIRKTGEVVEVIAYMGNTDRNEYVDYVSYIDSKGVEHHREQLNLFWDLEDAEPDENYPSQAYKERLQVAAMAMQGILASHSIMASITIAAQTKAAKQGIVMTDEEVSELTINAMATMAVKNADALLTELNKEKP